MYENNVCCSHRYKNENEETWRYRKRYFIFRLFLPLFLKFVKQALSIHLSVLIAHYFSEYIFIKIGNFWLGGGIGAVGAQPSFFPSLPTQPCSCLGIVLSGERGRRWDALQHSLLINSRSTVQILQAQLIISLQMCNTEITILSNIVIILP